MSEVYGLPVTALPDGFIPLSAVVVLRALDQDGDEALVVGTTSDLRTWDAVGMLRCGLVGQEDHLLGYWRSADEDENAEDSE